MRGMNRIAALAVASTVALTACDDSGDTLTPDTHASFAIMMQPETASGVASLVAGEPSAARISLDAVESITLPIGDVEALGSGNGGWIHAGSVDASIDLMALPEDGITLVDGSLPQGTYTALRFMLTDDATITLNRDITVGRTEYEAGTHTLVIPSSEQNGVRLRSDFEVDDDGQVLTVLFDGDATVRRVTATGAGILKIAPELRVEDEDGEDAGGIDDDEDDGEDDDEVEAEGIVASVTDNGFTFEDGTGVVINADTEIGGDLLSLEALADALADGETVRAEVEGALDDDGSTIIASEVEFEVDGDDDDEDDEDDDDEDDDA